ncbi:two-component response regulator-like APRR1 [Macadamia integrifolia]|uniref:two-component response regulator-like APRR1 n=1 Tax=Macadamia integrifolia TaxID=60698 RepID=UPI001C4FDC97|nr:two-component response regulator-like APRR1 [Macadamia integrifolia]
MYEYGDLFALTSSSFSPDPFFPATLSSPPPPPVTITPKVVVGEEYDSVPIGPSSLPSYSYYYPQRPSLLQRCMSSQSLPNDAFHYPHHNPIFSSLDESSIENFEFDSSPMRKVFSTGDLQTINLAQQRSNSPLSHENCNVEGSKKVRCYSAQERKERIERYRNKRSQRNFNKKIKYACRKTLADSRPRIRGRFARNDEIGESIQTQWSDQIGGEEDEEDDGVWANYFLSAFSTNLIP